MTEAAEPLLRVDGLVKHFPVTRGLFGRTVGQVRAVDGVSFELSPGETLGLVGESGCGKTTTGRAILRLIEPTAGSVRFDGKEVTTMRGDELRQLRRDMQIIFQDPFSSLNPRMRVLDIVGESLEVHGLAKGRQVENQVAELLRKVDISPAWANRYPHEFSGGQRQRIGIARAIALNPKLIVCDEAVSALDVSIRAQVINLLINLRQQMNLTYLFIAHDLAVVKHISNRVAVMYLGQIVELATSKRLFATPGHPYTRALLSAIPVPDPRKRQQRMVLEGDVPTPINPPGGCRFHTRCPAVFERCPAEEPPLYQLEGGQRVKCFHADGLEGDPQWHLAMNERVDSQISKNVGRRVLPVVDSEGVTLHTPVPAAAPPGHQESGEATAEREAETLSLRPLVLPAGLFLVAVGLLITALGPWLLGVLLVACGYLALLRPTIKRRRQSDLGTLALILVALATMVQVENRGQAQRARAELEALRSEVQGFKTAFGELPGSLNDLGWRLYPIFGEARAVDPWGNPWLYKRAKPEASGFKLRSQGPDGKNSDDDLVHVER